LSFTGGEKDLILLSTKDWFWYTDEKCWT